MPDFAENNKEVKRSKAEVAVYRLAKAMLFFLLLVSFFMALLSPYMGGGFFSYLFLLSPLLAIIVLVGVGFSSKNRSKTLKQAQENMANGILPPEKKIKNYGLRLLMMFGIVILGCAILGSVSMLISSVTDNVIWANFWSKAFSTIFLLLTIGIESFGIFKLIQLLRK